MNSLNKSTLTDCLTSMFNNDSSLTMGSRSGDYAVFSLSHEFAGELGVNQNSFGGRDYSVLNAKEQLVNELADHIISNNDKDKFIKITEHPANLEQPIKKFIPLR